MQYQLPIIIEASTIGEAWFKALKHIIEFGNNFILDIRIKEPWFEKQLCIKPGMEAVNPYNTKSINTLLIDLLEDKKWVYQDTIRDNKVWIDLFVHKLSMCSNFINIFFALEMLRQNCESLGIWEDSHKNGGIRILINKPYFNDSEELNLAKILVGREDLCR